MTYTPLPGYGPPPGAPGGDLRAVQPVTSVAKAVSVLLVVAAVAGVASGIASLNRASAIDDYLAGDIRFSALRRAEDVVGVVAIVDLLVVIGTGVVFMVWSWRVFKNAKVLAPDVAPRPGWAIGGWFIPLANLILPGYHLSRVDRISGSNGRGAQPLIVTWAILFGIANVLYRGLWRTTDDSLRAIQSADRRDLWLQLMFVVAAVLAILMVRSMTTRQVTALAEKFAREEAAIHPAPPVRRDLPAGYSAPIDPTVGIGVPRPLADPPPAPPGGPELRGPG